MTAPYPGQRPVLVCKHPTQDVCSRCQLLEGASSTDSRCRVLASGNPLGTCPCTSSLSLSFPPSREGTEQLPCCAASQTSPGLWPVRDRGKEAGRENVGILSGSQRARPHEATGLTAQPARSGSLCLHVNPSWGAFLSPGLGASLQPQTPLPFPQREAQIVS